MAILAPVLALLLYKGCLRFNYPSDAEFPIKGIDVSHHQKEIDWSKIKEQKIKFAFIKATEGEDFKDNKFGHNWAMAKENGIDVGAYHFFTFCKRGEVQARNFIETVLYEPNSLPPVIDLEYGGNCKLNKSKQEVLAEIERLEALLFDRYKKRPILYVTEEFYQDFLVGSFLQNPIWIRSVFRRPKVLVGRSWLFWQYANRGHLKGINTYVDLNVFNGDEEAYEELKKEVL